MVVAVPAIMVQVRPEVQQLQKILQDMMAVVVQVVMVVQ